MCVSAPRASTIRIRSKFQEGPRSSQEDRGNFSATEASATNAPGRKVPVGGQAGAWPSGQGRQNIKPSRSCIGGSFRRTRRKTSDKSDVE